MPNSANPLTPPYPDLLRAWKGPSSAREFDASLFAWLNRLFGVDVAGFSMDELAIVLGRRRGYPGNVANTLSHVPSIRQALTSLQLGGFGSVLREFEQLQTTPGLTPELRMLELYRNTGGVLGMCAGGTFLAIPCPSGEWAVTNGLQLQRQWSSPFAIDTYPIS